MVGTWLAEEVEGGGGGGGGEGEEGREGVRRRHTTRGRTRRERKGKQETKEYKEGGRARRRENSDRGDRERHIQRQEERKIFRRKQLLEVRKSGRESTCLQLTERKSERNVLEVLASFPPPLLSRQTVRQPKKKQRRPKKEDEKRRRGILPEADRRARSCQPATDGREEDEEESLQLTASTRASRCHRGRDVRKQRREAGEERRVKKSLLSTSSEVKAGIQ